MGFLPIIERELRVAARQPKTWWRRVITALAGTAVLAYIYLDGSRYMDASRLGRECFISLVIFGMVYATLAGALATADSLSSEKRGGTLGLLFLSNLRSLDIVAGKLAANSLNMFFGLMALLPVMALPLLLGGVTPGKAGIAWLQLANTMFLSLALGLLVSSLSRESRKAVAATTVALVLLNVGWPLLMGWCLSLPSDLDQFTILGAFSPTSGVIFLLDDNYSYPPAAVPINLLVTHLMAWGCLVAASRITQRTWQDRVQMTTGRGWRERWRTWSLGSPAARLRFRRRALESNPVFWLEARYHGGRALLWILLTVTGAGILFHFLSRNRYHDLQAGLLINGLVMHNLLCVWVAFQAGYRFAEDRVNGAVELLLCTPLSEREILRGHYHGVRHGSLGAMIGILLFELLWLVGQPFFHHHDDFEYYLACALGLTALPIQLDCVRWVCLRQSLVARDGIRAAVGGIWRVLLVPWAIFIGLVFFYDELRRMGGFFRIPDWLAISAWFAILAGIGLAFALPARRMVRQRLRSLAAQEIPARRWWIRFLPRGLRHP